MTPPSPAPHRGARPPTPRLLELGLHVGLLERPVWRRGEAADRVRDAQLQVHHDVPARVSLEDGLSLLHLAVTNLSPRGLHRLLVQTLDAQALRCARTRSANMTPRAQTRTQ
eukprot:6177480-Pleurochrysis_carterae.AAC.3